jgi:hypothetical protein
LIGVGVSGRSRLVASLNGNAFLRRLVVPDLGVDRSGEPYSMTMGFIGWSQGMCGVLALVGEVGEPWKTKKMVPGELQEGRGWGYQLLLYPRAGGRFR